MFEKTKKRPWARSMCSLTTPVSFSSTRLKQSRRRSSIASLIQTVLGMILVTQEALKYFPRTGGSIINISSITSANPVPNSRSIRPPGRD